MTMQNMLRHSTLLLVVSAVLYGCNGDAEKTEKTSKTKQPSGHSHGEKGPHKGVLVELGDHEYHGEVVHDEKTNIVTVYMLGGDAKTPAPISAKTVTVNLSHDGSPEEFTLDARPDKNDPMGKSSRFVTQGSELGEHLDLDDVTNRRLVVEIDGTSYSGAIKHSH